MAALTQMSMVYPYKLRLSPEMYNGSVVVEELSVAGNLDGAKMKTTSNSSSFDYWWFDLVSTTDGAAVNIVFYNAGDVGLDKPLSVEISGTFSNGTTFWTHVAETKGTTISNGPKGANAYWKSLDVGFRGSNLEKPNIEYEVNLDSPQLGVVGKITLKSVSDFIFLFPLGISVISANADPYLLACTCSLSLRSERAWCQSTAPSSLLLDKCRSRRRCCCQP